MGLIGQIAFANTHTNVGGTIDYADVYIALIDAGTGQPVNGNNTVVTYLINDNGTNITQNTTIAGQSALIDSGIITQRQDDGSGSGNYITIYAKNYTILNIAPPPNTAPPVNACDLLINFINIDKPESAHGAGNAQITVHARSSYLPLMFSLDNITYQTSNIFSGITGGLKTVYVTDSNSAGCSASLSVTIPVLNGL
ncbi:MAG TPA: hypothetical protein VNW51_00540, partial [Mucilaginibacter sp.]|nr:hypothetical protein [Mucilaginibacter sp.]